MITKQEFWDIYEKFFPKIFSYIFNRVDNKEVAEDLVSQVFFKALRNLEKYDESRWKMSTWLYAITTNAIIDHYKKSDDCVPLENHQNICCTENTSNEEIDFEINLDKAIQALSKLPVRTQEIIALRIYENLAFGEIAQIVWIWESWVKMSFQRWIETMRNSLNLLLLIIFLMIF
ncbi:MAG: Sigma-24, ECF subfamily protein [uncultured bacterium (gcode 4)]|uniref:Sigma-24, ECF subfamily protein n=1 Tax=uncultured bacterium (gcode 4) TaxID=1234023 RepID=K2G0Y5_9BACT|nr:MAG: Sigma-24, ECF subfamily protein [uncultured bacterium (gcode 4)]